jgi:hypothetical protein
MTNSAQAPTNVPAELETSRHDGGTEVASLVVNSPDEPRTLVPLAFLAEMRLSLPRKVGHTATATFVYHVPIAVGRSNAVIQ